MVGGSLYYFPFPGRLREKRLGRRRHGVQSVVGTRCGGAVTLSVPLFIYSSSSSVTEREQKKTRLRETKSAVCIYMAVKDAQVEGLNFQMEMTTMAVVVPLLASCISRAGQRGILCNLDASFAPNKGAVWTVSSG